MPFELPDTLVLMMIAVLLLPLVASAGIIAATRELLFEWAGPIATAVMAGVFGIALVGGFMWMGNPPEQPLHFLVPWIPTPGAEASYLPLGIFIDDLTIAMVVMVTGVSTLVHLYSIGYMKDDPRKNWFFAYLLMFTFSMLGIVLANSIIMLFVFWELVGLTSYLLIGFWMENKGPQAACLKAFVMNRIGDAGLLIGLGILFVQLGGVTLLPAAEGGVFGATRDALATGGMSIEDNPPIWLTVAGICLFFGAIGKSAQFPLHTWLPDAMEGPTPVSSIVHSATMVAAGVYLTARLTPILTPDAHLFVATIGLITLVIAAAMAMVMTDIKRVLAYSTISQLGYMILGVGCGAYVFALYHLITHAFFKCCLFQCAGSVIHAADHEQDMTQYGGLAKKMPITAAAYGVCTLAIAGASIPFLGIGISGFYSKDGVIAGAYGLSDALGGWGWAFFIGAIVVAYITPFYMARSFALTFLGKPRNQHLYDHAHEAPKTMVIPQVILAILAIVSVPWLLPWQSMIAASRDTVAGTGATWLSPLHEIHNLEHYIHLPLLYGFGWLVMIGLGVVMYSPGFAMAKRVVSVPGINLLHRWTLNKFYFDALYDLIAVGGTKIGARLAGAFDLHIVDGTVNLVGVAGKRVGGWVGQFDLRVVDGAVNAAANTARQGGRMLRLSQPGPVRAYALGLFVALAVLAVAVVVIVAGAATLTG